MKKAVFGFVLFVLAAGGYLFWRSDAGVVPPSGSQSSNPNTELDFLNLPEGFEISVATKDLDGPRVIVFDAKGRILVSETKTNRVSILEDGDKDGKFEIKRALIENLKSPHGLDFYPSTHSTKPQGGEPVESTGSGQASSVGTTYLYIAETHQVVRYAYDLERGELVDKNSPENIAFLPGDGRHFTRTIAFGPNFRKTAITKGLSEKETLSPTKLYISVGSSCDVCLESSWKNAAILESDPEGNFTAEFAGGLRNSVFFTFHPETKEIWATEMGRDNLGDDLPPDEINIVKVADKENKFGARRFGWPFCYGNKIQDKTFKSGKVDRLDIPTDCRQTEPATIELPAHSAPLGLAFVSNSKWPKEWQNNLLVAYHGSWNRSEPTGYKIVRFKVDKNGKVSKIEDFISGWLQTSPDLSDRGSSIFVNKNRDNQILGRPVDLKFGPDGALYVSDDASGVIYKVILSN